MRVLIVEDDRQISEWQRRVLSEAGYQSSWANTGTEAQRLASSSDYDLAIIDLGLPDVPGLSLITALRSAGHTLPIIILSGRGEESAAIAGLDAGADDFLVKPTSAQVLLARVRAALRRGGSKHSTEQRIGVLYIDQRSRVVHVGDRNVTLTRKEFDLLAVLAAQPEQMVPRSDLLRRVWGLDFSTGTNVLEATMSRLRAKIGAPGCIPYIRTFRNTGYMLTSHVADPDHAVAVKEPG